LIEERPAQFNALWREVVQDVCAGLWQPLRRTVFSISAAVDAFREMAQARHMGKIVLSFRDASTALILPDAEDAVAFKADSTYLITGGLGALGLQVARWMVLRGARHLALTGRSEPTPNAVQVLNSLREAWSANCNHSGRRQFGFTNVRSAGGHRPRPAAVARHHAPGRCPRRWIDDAIGLVAF
jgi:hypothetical protein